MYILYIMYFCIQKELLGRKLVNIGKRIRDAALSIIIHSFTFAP